eukprot:m.74283 g.74283  ORF g.74283 m.74283 type:complete len:401 (-) comp12391_c1_seq1:680-1882(-)
MLSTCSHLALVAEQVDDENPVPFPFVPWPPLQIMMMHWSHMTHRDSSLSQILTLVPPHLPCDDESEVDVRHSPLRHLSVLVLYRHTTSSSSSNRNRNRKIRIQNLNQMPYLLLTRISPNRFSPFHMCDLVLYPTSPDQDQTLSQYHLPSVIHVVSGIGRVVRRLVTRHYSPSLLQRVINNYHHRRRSTARSCLGRITVIRPHLTHQRHPCAQSKGHPLHLLRSPQTLHLHTLPPHCSLPRRVGNDCQSAPYVQLRCKWSSQLICPNQPPLAVDRSSHLLANKKHPEDQAVAQHKAMGQQAVTQTTYASTLKPPVCNINLGCARKYHTPHHHKRVPNALERKRSRESKRKRKQNVHSSLTTTLHRPLRLLRAENRVTEVSSNSWRACRLDPIQSVRDCRLG